MSIFRSTFKPYIVRQLNARQFILKQGDNNVTRPINVQQYTLSKTPWCRMVSFVNYDSPDNKYKGDELARKYVLQGGTLLPGTSDSFAQRSGVGNRNGSYGSNLGNRQLGLRPMPGISSMEIKSKGEYGSLQEATVKYYCWDKAQLDDLEVLFMRPGFSVMVEWGWSQYLDTTSPSKDETYDTESDSKSLTQTDAQIADMLKANNYIKSFTSPTLNPFDTSKNQDDIYEDIKRLQHKFHGNYGGMIGKIRNFTWELLPNGGYECTTIIISIGDTIGSIKMNRADDTFRKDDIQKKNDGYNNNFTRFLDRLTSDDLLPKLNALLNNDPRFDYKTITFNMKQGNAANQKVEQSSNPHNGQFIHFGTFLSILNEYFNLYQDTGEKLINIESPVYEPKHIGNGLCLASVDSVSIDPTVCLIQNPKATFVTGLPGGCDIPKYQEIPGLNSMLPFLHENTSFGIIGNIYLNIARAKDTFQEMLNANIKTGVFMYEYIKKLLNLISDSIGGINDFDIFVIDNKSVIIDKNYVEPDVDTKRSNKYEMNLFGNNSVVRNYKVSSKIFQSQASMIAIAAGVRENLTSVQNSTYVYLAKGLSDRVTRQLNEYENRGNDSTAEKVKKERENLISSVKDLQRFLREFLTPKGAIQTAESSIAEAHTLLNSILLRVDVDTNYKAIIPIDLEVTMDGISGIFPNQIFTVNKDILPTEWSYKKIGFITTAVTQTITPTAWLTTLNTQTCLLDQETLQKQSVSIETEKANLLAGVSSLIADTKQKNKAVADNYNALLRFIQYYYENKIQVNLKLNVKRKENTAFYNDSNSFITNDSSYDNYSDFKITSINASGVVIGNMLGNLNLLDTTGIFKAVPLFENGILKTEASEVKLNINNTIISEREKPEIPGTEYYKANIKILNPFIIKREYHKSISSNNIGIRSTPTEGSASKDLIYGLIKQTNEYKSLPTNIQEFLSKELDSIVESIFDKAKTSIHIYFKKPIYDSFGEVKSLENDPNISIDIITANIPS